MSTAVEERTQSAPVARPSVEPKLTELKPLTEDDRKRRQKLEAVYEKGERQSSEALRTIRKEKLWRGDYRSFDEYMLIRWGKSKNWATQQTNWLRVTEFLEEHKIEWGKEPYRLTVEECQQLIKIVNELPDDLSEDEEQEFSDFLARLTCDALVEARANKEVTANGRKRDLVREAVEKRLAYIENRNVHGDDLTLEESVQLSRLEGQPDDKAELLLASAREGATKEGRSSADCLKELVDQIVQESEDRRKKEKLETEARKHEEAAAAIKRQLTAYDPGDEKDDDDAEDSEDEAEESKEPAENSNDDEGANEQLAFDVQLTGDLAELSSFEPGRVTNSELVDLFYELADEAVVGRIRSGAITIKMIEANE